MGRVLQSEKLFFFSYFPAVIAFGTVVFYLPFIDALFIAPPAVCVTGLITVETSTYTTVGQEVILLLVQGGGPGIITFSTIYLARPRGKMSLVRHRAIRGFYLESTGLGR